jgi:hypothetical protein
MMSAGEMTYCTRIGRLLSMEIKSFPGAPLVGPARLMNVWEMAFCTPRLPHTHLRMTLIKPGKRLYRTTPVLFRNLKCIAALIFDVEYETKELSATPPPSTTWLER